MSNHLSAVVLLPIVLLALLLCFPTWSVAGAANGLLLWFHVVLPTLSPFIICTQVIVALDGIKLMMKPVYPVFRRLFGLSLSGAYVMLCGLLCGYPLGAKLCADFKEREMISQEEANYLFILCNHPSPMFLLGYVRGQLPFSVSPVLLLICLYLPVLPISFMTRVYYGKGKHSTFRLISTGKSCIVSESHNVIRPTPFIPFIPSIPSTSSTPSTPNNRFSLEDIIHSTCETMVLIGGYIMLFSILAAWISHLTMIPQSLRVLLMGLAEITTGVQQICVSAALPTEKILSAVVATVAFGGFSGIFQTKSVIKNAGLSIRHYVLWKLIHSGLSVLFLKLIMFCY